MPVILSDDSVFSEAKTQGKKVILESRRGSGFSRVALEAIEIQKEHPEANISFLFIGTEVPVKASDKAADLEKRYDEINERTEQEWTNSPAGKAQIAQQQAEPRRPAPKATAAKAQIKGKYQFTEDMAQITGYGAKLEKMARDSVVFGLEWLDKHPGKDISKEKDLNELEAVIDAYYPGHSGASLGAVMAHINMAVEKGWDNYVSESKEVAAQRQRGR